LRTTPFVLQAVESPLRARKCLREEHTSAVFGDKNVDIACEMGGLAEHCAPSVLDAQR
jgi:hypothetical protein